MLILVGKTASGKDSTLNELVKMGYKPIVSYTTRPPRVNEVDGLTYHFISQEEFLKKKEDGFFAETTSYNVASGETWYYGAAVEDLTDDKVAILNIEGIKAIKNIPGIDSVVFYLDVPDNIIKSRLINRQDNPQEAQRRLETDNRDFEEVDNIYDYKIFNDDKHSPRVMAEIINAIYKGEYVCGHQK